MASRHEYHAYVVNDVLQPLRVLALRDIISLFVCEPPGYFAEEKGAAGYGCEEEETLPRGSASME